MNAVIRLTLLCAALLSDLDGASLRQTVDSIMGNRTGAAVALDDKSLDAQVDDEGTVAFTLAEQAV